MRCQSLLSVYTLSEQSSEHGLAREHRQGAKLIREDHMSSEVHRKALCMPQCINNIPFVRCNKVLAKTGDDSGSTNKYRVSEKVSKTTPASFKFKRNMTKIKSNIWQLVSPPPQFNCECAPLVFRDGFSKVQRPSKTDSLELLPSDNSRIISPLRKLLNRVETLSTKFPEWKPKYFSEDIFPLLLGW